jgi:glycosyltransferase involved in cell wall biosynthesis
MISMIVPVYQSEKYIEDCIQSILNQTYSDIELILVDDGSTDGSGIICDEYSRIDRRVRVIHTENKGVSHARNIGIENSKGEYILFVDSDDTIDKNMIKEMITAVDETECDIVVSSFAYVYPNEIKTISNLPINTGIYSVSDFFIHFYQLYYSGILSNIGIKLYKSSIIKENLIKFDDRYSICEDINFCLDYIMKSNSIFFLNKPLYFYNKLNINTLMSSYKENLFEAKKIVFEKLSYIMNKNNILSKLQNEYYSTVMKDSIMIISNEFQFNDNRSYAKIKKNLMKVLFDNEVILSKSIVNSKNIRRRFFYNLIWLRSPLIITFVMKLFYLTKRMKR